MIDRKVKEYADKHKGGSILNPYADIIVYMRKHHVPYTKIKTFLWMEYGIQTTEQNISSWMKRYSSNAKKGKKERKANV